MVLYNTWPLRIDYLFYEESEINNRRAFGNIEKSEDSNLDVRALFSKENIRGWIYGLTEDFFSDKNFNQKAPMAVYQRKGTDYDCDCVELNMLYSECSFFCSKLRTLINSTNCCRKVDHYISNLFLGKTKDSLYNLDINNFDNDIYKTVLECSLVTELNKYYVEYYNDGINIHIKYKCPRTYMTEIAYPIFLNNKVIAVLIAGQFVNKEDIPNVNEKIDLYNEEIIKNPSIQSNEIKQFTVSHFDDKNKAVKDKDQLQKVVDFFQERINALEMDLETRYIQNLNDLVFRITNDVFINKSNLHKNFSSESKNIITKVAKQISANRILLLATNNNNKSERNFDLTLVADTSTNPSKAEFKLNKDDILEYKNNAGNFQNENIILVNAPDIFIDKLDIKNSDISFIALLTNSDEITFVIFLSFDFQMNADEKNKLIELLAKIGIALSSEYEIFDNEKNECIRKYKIRKKYAQARNELIHSYAYRYHIYNDMVVSELLLDTNLRRCIRSDDVSVEDKKKALKSIVDKTGLNSKALIPVVNGIICEYDEDTNSFINIIDKVEFYIRINYFNDKDESLSKAIISIHSDETDEIIKEEYINQSNEKYIKTEVNFILRGKEKNLCIEIVTLLNSMIRDIDLPFVNGKIYGKYALKMNDDLLLILLIDVFETSITRLLRDMYKITTTKAYCHLQYKTQVMMNSFSDDQTTRLMHSIAVCNIASTLAKQFHANWELAEAIAIGHDVGHTPFGHAGEEALDNCLSTKFFGRFQHALQGVKVLNNYEKHKSMERYGFHGIGVSKELLIGILKHDTDMVTDNVYSAGYQLQYDISRHLGDNIKKTGNIETQIVYWSDKIAYLGHDWEEFSNSKIMHDLFNTVNNIYYNIVEVFNTFGGKRGLANAEIKKDEYKLVIDIIELIDELKGEIYDKNYINLEQFVFNLREIIKANEYKTKDKITFSYITENHYDKFYSFFEIADAWSRLLNKQINVKPYTNDNFILIIYNFLTSIKADQVASELHNRLVAYSYKKINSIMSQDEFNKRSEEKWTATLKKYNKLDTDKDLKSIYQEMLLITMDPDKYLIHIKTIKKFISKYYHNSVLVKGMNMKAERIINSLFNEYIKEPKMLPPEYRQKYYKLTEANIKIYKSSVTFESCDDGAEDDGKGVVTQLLIKNLNELISSIESIKSSDNKIIELINLRDILSDESETNETRDNFIKNAILARIVADYIASMTDRMAIKKYNEFNSSEIDWSYVDE